ncbi:hypothetical protein MJ585_22320 [Klebsiella pneumoniae]|nr:hypothetical protein MJ585_22320 [Klebsiella pneumoniae]
MTIRGRANIRELENTLHNAVLLSKEERSSCPAAPGDAQRRPGAGASDRELDDFIRHQLAPPASRCGSE